MPVDYINLTFDADRRHQEIELSASIRYKCPPIRDLVAHWPLLGDRRAGSDLFAFTMQSGFICESANIEDLDPLCGHADCARASGQCEAGCVLSNSFGLAAPMRLVFSG